MLGLYRLAIGRDSEYVTWESAIMVSIEMERGKWVSATPRKTPRKLALGM
jgi:hypothetical protein